MWVRQMNPFPEIKSIRFNEFPTRCVGGGTGWSDQPNVQDGSRSIFHNQFVLKELKFDRRLGSLLCFGRCRAKRKVGWRDVLESVRERDHRAAHGPSLKRIRRMPAKVSHCHLDFVMAIVGEQGFAFVE